VKQIKAIITGVAHVSTSGINLTEAVNLAHEARRNRLKVIEGALTIENQLETIIQHYFFGTSHEKRAVFKSIVLDSDWCFFAAKRKLITYIIDEQNLLEGRAKNDFDKLMRDVMSIRNAFAHGKFSSDDSEFGFRTLKGNPETKS
jgi:hypothetical protein